jgi:hypothetical protein
MMSVSLIIFVVWIIEYYDGRWKFPQIQVELDMFPTDFSICKSSLGFSFDFIDTVKYLYNKPPGPA